MARQTLAFVWQSHSQYATQYTVNGNIVYMAILGEPDKFVAEPLRDRSRPTGEVGSGPYFNAYYKPPSGVLSYYETTSGALYTDNADYDEVVFDKSWMTAANWYLRHNSKDEMYAASARFSGQPGNLNTHFYYARIEKFSIYHGFWGKYPEIDGWVREESLHTTTIESAKAIFEIWLRQQKNTASRHSRPNMIPTIGITRLRSNLPEQIPYALNERTNFEYYTAFNEIMLGRYRSLQDQAYINAAENLPQAATNSIANVLEWAGTIKDIASGHLDGFGSLKDAWLGYRYSYGTTKLDIQEYANFTQRLASLANMPTITCYGEAERWGIRCLAQFELDVDQFIPKNSLEWLKAYGFKFSAVNAWDMIPYSFVVDWFLHVGDILQAFENADMMYHLYPRNFWNTFITNYDGVKTYTRVPGEWRYAIPWLTFGGASNKTIGKRVLDSIALFIA